MNIYINGGTVRADQTTNIVGGSDYTFLYYSGNRINYTLGNSGLTVEVNNADTITRISGTLKNASGATGTLTKTGTGKLQLSAANSYTGVTTIKGGEVEIIEFLNPKATSGYTGGFSMQGGTLRNSSAEYAIPVNGATAGTNVLLGNVKDNAINLNTAMTISGSSTQLSLGDATDAGNLTATGYVLVTEGATLNIVNGTNTINGRRVEAQADGIRVYNNSILNVSGGDTTMGYNLRLENGTMTMTGGTVTVGTNTAGDTNYSAFIGGNGKGTATISGGTLDAKWNIMVGWYASNSSLTLNGGTLKAANSSGGLVFGNSTGCSIDLISGTVAVNRFGNRQGDSDTAGTINIYGKNIHWSSYDGTGNISAVYWNAKTTANLVVASNGFSTLEATNVDIGGSVKVSYAGGVGTLSEGYDLIKSTNTLAGSGTVNSTGLFTTEKGSNAITLSGMNSALEVEATFSSDAVDFTAANSGWFEVPYDISDLTLNVDLSGSSADAFLTWLNDGTYFDHNATLEGNKLTLGSLSAIAAGEKFFWDFSEFGTGVTLTGLSGTVDISVPEPSTLALLLGGWALLLGIYRRKRFAKRGGICG
ncbi:MAG: autotransporter-associated beta strand repeat-containing protein [Planctomycetia bacterium]|nr:autotransporter-associated beta strand repeat-containing protein [Planctomycetia bacterium]